MRNATSINCIYGDGAPTGIAPSGTRYIDSTANAEYEYSGGAWNQLTGGGSSGGLQYYLPYPGVGYEAVINVNAQNPLTYGAIEMIGKFSVTGSLYGTVFLSAGLGLPGKLRSTNSVVIGSGYGGAGSTSIYGKDAISMSAGAGGFIYLNNIPNAAGGPLGSVWNNLGVLNIN